MNDGFQPETNFYLRHMHAPAADIEKFTSEEKRRLLSILRKRMFLKSFIYVVIIACSVSVLIYFNYIKSAGETENIGLLNVVFIVTIFISARISMGDFLEYLKEARSPFKKIVNTRIVKHEGSVITIGNQEFKKEDILLDASDFDLLQAGDHVRVEHSEKSHTLFSVKKI